MFPQTEWSPPTGPNLTAFVAILNLLSLRSMCMMVLLASDISPDVRVIRRSLNRPGPILGRKVTAACFPNSVEDLDPMYPVLTAPVVVLA